MDFLLTAEQELLRDTVAGLLARDRHPDLWLVFAHDLGILGAALPESVGGSGGGPVETMVIAEQLGHAHVAEPYVDTVVLGGSLLRHAGGDRATEVLVGLVGGTARPAPALLEPGSGHTAHDVSTTARRGGDGWVLSGAKTVVAGAPQATHLLVTARTAGERRDLDGISLFLVPFDAAAPPAGVRVDPVRTIDGRRAADLVFDEVRLPADALLGAEGAAWDGVACALDEAIAAVAAEAVGCMRKVLADTVEYTRNRRQFGQPIAAFQVLQHRMVDMYIEVEQSVAAVYLATLRLGAGPVERARAVSAAKVTIGRAARMVGQNAVQLHGGMGMTQELAIGRYFTRLTAIEYEFGSADQHLARYAALAETPS